MSRIRDLGSQGKRPNHWAPLPPEKYFDGYLSVNNFILKKYQFCGISVNKRDSPKCAARGITGQTPIQVNEPVQQDLTSFIYLKFEKSKR